MSAPDICPNCGAEVPRGAKACPECGSDEQTGWSDEAHASRLDLPNQEFDYNDFVRKEFAAPSPVPRGLRWWWWLVGILVLVGLLLLWI